MDMDNVMELFILTKGVANVIRLSHSDIRKGPMAVMLEDQAYPEGTDIHLPLSISSRFEGLQLMLATYGLDEEALEHCQSALTELQEIYKNIAYFSPMASIVTGMVSQWQVRISMGYVRLIQARNPPALIVLAYYAAAITSIRTAWYTQNWAEYALRGISQAVDDDMQQWIQWPMQQVQEHMNELGVHCPDEGSGIYSPLAGYMELDV